MPSAPVRSRSRRDFEQPGAGRPVPLRRHVEPPGRSAAPPQVAKAGDLLSEIYSFAADREFSHLLDASVQSCQREQPFDGLIHLLTALPALFEHLAVFRGRTRLAKSQVDRGQQRGQRRSQFMRDIGRGLLLPSKGAFEKVQRLRHALGNGPQFDGKP